jgi:hypothetical protein
MHAARPLHRCDYPWYKCSPWCHSVTPVTLHTNARKPPSGSTHTVFPCGVTNAQLKQCDMATCATCRALYSRARAADLQTCWWIMWSAPISCSRAGNLFFDHSGRGPAFSLLLYATWAVESAACYRERHNCSDTSTYTRGVAGQVSHACGKLGHQRVWTCPVNPQLI